MPQKRCIENCVPHRGDPLWCLEIKERVRGVRGSDTPSPLCSCRASQECRGWPVAGRLSVGSDRLQSASCGTGLSGSPKEEAGTPGPRGLWCLGRENPCLVIRCPRAAGVFRVRLAVTSHALPAGPSGCTLGCTNTEGERPHRPRSVTMEIRCVGTLHCRGACGQDALMVGTGQ